MPKIGDRVGAVLKTTSDTVELIGYGTYAGDEIPHDKVAFMGGFLREIKRPNPKIQLDSGQNVFGCECWWGPEKEVKKIIGDRSIIGVDIDKLRCSMEGT